MCLFNNIPRRQAYDYATYYGELYDWQMEKMAQFEASMPPPVPETHTDQQLRLLLECLVELVTWVRGAALDEIQFVHKLRRTTTSRQHLLAFLFLMGMALLCDYRMVKHLLFSSTDSAPPATILLLRLAEVVVLNVLARYAGGVCLAKTILCKWIALGAPWLIFFRIHVSSNVVIPTGLCAITALSFVKLNQLGLLNDTKRYNTAK